ncbi:MAG: RNA polymerase factor sigma-54 [Phycisphaerae bacterium]|nr:RNA polymerase factor sigma-54 [Phycisphaerae bacterium]
MRLEQRMKLAPRMIQSMEILQLPLMALQERIEQELISNPVLEMLENDPDQPNTERSDEPAENPQQVEVRQKDLVIGTDRSRKEDFERLAEIADDGDFDDYYVGAHGGSFRGVFEDDRDHKLDAMANTAARGMSLHEYLTLQWTLIDADPDVRRAGQLIVNNLEDDGYLRVEMEDLAHRGREPVTQEQLHRALLLVQAMDPPGVGARDLQECLLLQMDAVVDPLPIHNLARRVAEDHLKDIEANRLPAIAKAQDVTLDDVREAIQYLHRFDPRPGQRIGQDKVPYVVPDVVVDYNESGDGYVVRLASGNEPSLYINHIYRRMLRSNKLDPKTRDFIKKNIQSARWLLDSLEQRRSTLLRVTEAIVHFQKDFFDNGPKHLKPLPMAAVASRVGIHLATVSRAVSDKWMQCPQGICPLRQFFSAGVATQDGDSMSWGAVKVKMQELIGHEDKATPLSDDEIVDKLKADGIVLARRTVAKYRKALNIPSARQRKSF